MALAPFPLLDAAGDEVGECTVSQGSVDCSLSNYVSTHTHVHGDLWLKVKAHYVQDVDHVDITETGGATHRIDLTVAPRATHTPTPRPQHRYVPGQRPTKRRRALDNTRRTVDWEVTAPSSERPSNGPLVIEDTWKATAANAGAMSLSDTPQLRCKAPPMSPPVMHQPVRVPTMVPPQTPTATPVKVPSTVTTTHRTPPQVKVPTDKVPPLAPGHVTPTSHTPHQPAVPGTPSLAHTGTDAPPMVLAALLLMMGGAGAVVASRKRH